MADDNVFKFEVPGQEITLVLERCKEGELTDFSMRYAAKAKAFESLKVKTALLESMPAERIPMDYGERLEQYTLQQMRKALELHKLITDMMRGKIIKTLCGEEGLDASTPEGWVKVFNAKKGQGMENLSKLAAAFITAHSPEEMILKNSVRA